MFLEHFQQVSALGFFGFFHDDFLLFACRCRNAIPGWPHFRDALVALRALFEFLDTRCFPGFLVSALRSEMELTFYEDSKSDSTTRRQHWSRRLLLFLFRFSGLENCLAA